MTDVAGGATRGAAFFDLDRTLLAGASGEVFTEAMREAGIGGGPYPGEAIVYRLFGMVGETLPSMALARQAVALVRGHRREAVQAAAVHVAPRLAAMVQPGAAAVFARHRAAGQRLVLATTTPYDLVRPLADLLGLDDVVATRHRVDADGVYDGSLDGPFVWSAGKLEAVRNWAETHGVDLAESHAYSDSFYDAPLLSAVGHPHVVNPDPRLTVVAALRRWPTVDLRRREPVPVTTDEVPGATGSAGLELQRVAMSLLHPAMFPYARFRIEGADRIPRTGAAIIVANHRSYFDPAAIALLIAKAHRTVRFLGKKEVFEAPVVGQFAAAMGGIRVDRGTGSDAPLAAAAEALAAGDLVALMPQGTIPRGRAFYDPVLVGRWGAARLAAMTGAPVIPVGLWGTEQVWPRSARVPNVLEVLDPPTVTVAVGDPVPVLGRSPAADTKRIMSAIVDLLPPEARVRREPSAEEIARALPPGVDEDRGDERRRRPGTD